MKKFAVLVLGLTFLWTNPGYSMKDDPDNAENHNISVLRTIKETPLPLENSKEESSSNTKAKATFDPIFWSVEERAKYVSLGFFGSALLYCAVYVLCLPV